MQYTPTPPLPWNCAQPYCECLCPRHVQWDVFGAGGLLSLPEAASVIVGAGSIAPEEQAESAEGQAFRHAKAQLLCVHVDVFRKCRAFHGYDEVSGTLVGLLRKCLLITTTLTTRSAAWLSQGNALAISGTLTLKPHLTSRLLFLFGLFVALTLLAQALHKVQMLSSVPILKPLRGNELWKLASCLAVSR